MVYTVVTIEMDMTLCKITTCSFVERGGREEKELARLRVQDGNSRYTTYLVGYQGLWKKKGSSE